MSILKPKASPIREKRLYAVSAYYGKADTILGEYEDNDQFTQRVRTFTHDIQSDILTALNVIATIKDAAVVVHGAQGCGVGRLSFDEKGVNNKWAVTNLNERDSIMGSEAKLRDAIIQVYKLHNPRVIFVVSTAIVAINNDDIESVVEELKHEIDAVVIPVYSIGFRSKIASTGLDLVTHSIVRRFYGLKEEAIPSGFVNLISVAEKEADVSEAIRLLHELGLETNIFPRYASFENIRKVPNASFSIGLNPDDSVYPAEILKERFGIPNVSLTLPVGIENSARWITDIAIATGRQSEAHALITREKEKLSGLIKKKGAEKPKVFISLPPSYAIAIYALSKELGYEVTGLKLSFIDNQHHQFVEQIKAERPDLPVFVGDGQYFEEENVIRKGQPDLYIGGSGADFAIAVRNGIPVVNIDDIPVFGFDGVVNFASKVTKTLANTSFFKSVSPTGESQTYINEWLRKSTNWFIKHEVK